MEPPYFPWKRPWEAPEPMHPFYHVRNAPRTNQTQPPGFQRQQNDLRLLPPPCQSFQPTQRHYFRPSSAPVSFQAGRGRGRERRAPDHRVLRRMHPRNMVQQPRRAVEDCLSQQIFEFYEIHRQKAQTLHLKEECRLRLLDVLRYNLGIRDMNVYLLGSSVTGFCDDDGDADYCLIFDSDLDRQEKVEVLQIVKETLQKESQSGKASFYRISLIRARVPIIRMKYEGIHADIGVDNLDSLKNSSLMRAFGRINPKVPSLVILIKAWSKRVGVNDAKCGYLSSYSVVLMILFYLQNCQPPVLPQLKAEYQDSNLLNSLDYRDPRLYEGILGGCSPMNGDDCGNLLMNFFLFYEKFDFGNEIISIRLGKTYRKPRDDLRWFGEVCIEEPFKLDNVARSFRSSSMRYLRSQISKAAEILLLHRTIGPFLEMPNRR